MTREQLLARIDAAWQAFGDSYAGLTDEQLQEPGVAGDWSVKDLIAHVTWWEQEALKHVPLIVAGGRPPRYSVTYGGIDAFNTLMAEKKRDRSLAEIRNESEDTHRRLLAMIRDVPEDHFTRETRVRRRLRLDTYSHYPIHTEAIRQWREQRFAG